MCCAVCSWASDGVCAILSKSKKKRKKNAQSSYRWQTDRSANHAFSAISQNWISSELNPKYTLYRQSIFPTIVEVEHIEFEFRYAPGEKQKKSTNRNHFINQRNNHIISLNKFPDTWCVFDFCSAMINSESFSFLPCIRVYLSYTRKKNKFGFTLKFKKFLEK